MTDNELLLAISNIIHTETEPIKEDIREIKDDLLELKAKYWDMDKRLRDLENRVDKIEVLYLSLKEDVQHLESCIRNIQEELDKMKVEINDIKNTYSTIYTDINDLKQYYDMLKFDANSMLIAVDSLKVNVDSFRRTARSLGEDLRESDVHLQDINERNNNMEIKIRNLRILLEQNILPRLQNIEACYISTFERCQSDADHMESLQVDMDIVKKVVTEHSSILNKAI